MTTPSEPPASDQDCIKLEKLQSHVSDGNNCKPVSVSPLREMNRCGSSGGGRKLSTISELDTDRSSHEPLGASGWAGSGLSMCSDKWKNSSSHYSSDDSYQPGPGEDCAALLLACLYCRFHELMILLPDTAARAVSRCFPSCKYIMASGGMDEQGLNCCHHQLELDCNVCGDSCQDVGELVELAMEMSEMCYR